MSTSMSIRMMSLIFRCHETLRCRAVRRYPPRPIVRRARMAVPIAISLADQPGLRPSGNTSYSRAGPLRLEP